jgi:gluconate 2-dehydrogenase gamma chain
MAEKQNSNEPEKTAVSRRALFSIIGAAPVFAAAATAAETHAHHPASAPHEDEGPYKRKVFDDHQWRTVHVLCDLIIPADARSGSASQAGVPEFLDDWIAFRTDQDLNENLQAQILGGLMWLDRESTRLFEKDFADAAPDQQKQILDRIAYPHKLAKEDHPWAMFFSEFRSLTVSGFFSSKMGVADLPYLGNTAVTEWKGCDAEVWGIVQQRMKAGYKGILEVKPWSA